MFFFCCILQMGLATFIVPCQARAAHGSTADDRQLEIHKISFYGNSAFDDGKLRFVIQSKEAPGFFARLFFREKTEHFLRQVFEDDWTRLETFYKDKGYFRAKVNGEFKIDSSNYSVELTYAITENSRSSIDSVLFVGLENIPQGLANDIFREPLIQKGEPFEQQRSQAEIARVLNILVDNGYPLAQYDRDSSKAKFLTSTGNFFIVLVFKTGRRYSFGESTVHLDPPREDITDNLVLRQLDFEPGETYSREKKFNSERDLNRLDIFESVRVDHKPFSDTMTTTSIPMEMFVVPRARHEISPELGVSDENNAFNLSFGLGYTNRNFLGDARTFNIRTRVRTQSVFNWDFGQVFGGQGFKDSTVVGGLELQFQVLQPYLFTKTLSGSWTSSISAEKQHQYILYILRNKMGLSKRFWDYTYGLLDWTLERVNPEFPYSNTISLAEEDQPQFNSILTLTLQTDRTNDIFSPTEGFFRSVSVEESGLLPNLIHVGLPFTQYYKITLFGRWYQDLTSTRYNIFALKLKTGYQDKYGDSKLQDVKIPLNRRFFGGGSGSVRGWRARELGAMRDELLEFGGNFAFEGSAELRINYFRGFGDLLWIKLDNIWGVYFIDFGNVWSDIGDFKAKDIAIAAGIGFRYETLFGPFRVDYGFRLYDPKEDSGRQTIFQKRFFGETLPNAVFHFGIGHAF